MLNSRGVKAPSFFIMRTYLELEKESKEKGFVWFYGKYNLNIIAVRNTSNPQPNKFDDELYVCYQDEEGNKKIFFCKCTTEPGTYWLQNPMDKGGAGAIVEGQYRGLWTLSSFKGYPALVQVNKVRLYRDNDKDTKFDYRFDSITEGYYGIFLHPSFQGTFANNVNMSSAGCIVPQSTTDFEYFIHLCKMQIKCGFGNKFSLSLLKSKDFE